MEFPVLLLPTTERKHIVCDLSDYFLIRYTERSCEDPTSTISTLDICIQSKDIADLSTSLLSIYKIEHVRLELTKIGKEKFAEYCAPDLEIEPHPQHEIDFIDNDKRGFWTIRINDIHNQQANFTMGENQEKFTARCVVVHTPTKWNFWHFSIRWLISTGFMLNDLDDKPLKKYAKKLSGETYALIKQYAQYQCPEYPILNQACYTK
jgi:hypothetical protein